MKKFLLFLSFVLLVEHQLEAQCYNGFNEGGILTPITNLTQSVQVGSGTYATINVKQGGIYSFGHCGTVPNSWGQPNYTSDSRMHISNTSNNLTFAGNDDGGPLCSASNDASIQWNATLTGQVRVHSNGWSCQGWLGGGSGNSATLTYRCDPPNSPAVGTPGDGIWNVYAYNAGDAAGGSGAWQNNYSGYYTNNNLNFNTATHWANSPSDAPNYLGCHISNDNHSWRAIRTGWNCDVYNISVPGNDDIAKLFINGIEVWSDPNGCCNNNGVVYTAALSSSDVVEFRVSEGGGGSNGRIEFTPVTTSLDGGVVSFSGSNNACDGYNPPAFSNVTSPSGGSSAAVNNGSSSYQWQLNGSNINGATGLTFDPGVLSAGTYTFRRGVTDKCGNVAYSNSITITVTAAPDAGTLSGIQDVCVGSTTNFSSDGDGGGTWSSNAGSVATVNSSGIVTGVAAGTATITYTVAGSGGCADASATRDITIYANPLAANAGEDKPACINNPATLSASNPPIGSGTWTWSTSAPVYAGGTTANDYNAQVTFSAAGSYRGIWTVTSGPCATTSSDTMYVNVSAANNNASLFSSAGAAAESVQAFEVCEEGAWTYYAAPGAPDEYLFAINKHGSSFSAYVDIVDLPGTQTIESLGGSPAIRGTWLIGRYWNVSLLSGSLSTTVDVRFFVDPAEVTQAENEATAFLNNTAAATNMTALTFFKTVSSTFDPATSLVNGEFTFAPAYLPYTTGTLNGVNYYELTGLTSFSGGTGGFSVNDSGSPLPVELLEFNVSTVDNRFIRLDWATASEINNDGFEVLRSTDGVNFERIAWIGGNGNSTEINEYVFNDRGVDKGITYYYQLKQIDYDGQYEYFDVKSARLDGKTTFTVGALVPNPSKGNSVVAVQVETISGEVLTLDIYDRIGAKVKSMTYVLYAAENGLDIDISDLEEGTYFLSFESSMGTETRKLVVVK
ncbi:Ig-like domain-containing protein [Chitinophagales bacterium]|nr:Ig-like domain-containing protein [Chitinophagales bacterium]